MSDPKKITNVSGSIWISKKTNQLRFKHKDTNSEWLIPTSVYKAGANILRGQVVALGDVKDKGTGPFIVPYKEEDSQLFHSWPLGIALEPGNSEDMIHVLSKGKLEYNTEKYPEESIDFHFIQNLNLSEEDIGGPIFVLPNGELSKTDEDSEALCVGRILYAPGNGESSNKIIIEFDFSYGESLFTKKKRKELKDDLTKELAGKADEEHSHILEDIDDLEEKLDGKADKDHFHELEDIEDLTEKLDGKADKVHKHKLENISDFDEELPSKIEKFAGNCIAIFDPDNGDHFSFSVKAKGDLFTVPLPEPTKKNFEFLGWEVIEPEPEPEPEPEELKKEPFEANHSVLLRAQYCPVFISTWNISSSNLTLTLPITGQTQDFEVDWGDGSEPDTSLKHTYVEDGVYEVRVYGSGMFGFSHDLNAHAPKLISIISWGDIKVKNDGYQFYNCSNLVDVGDIDISHVTKMSNMFYNASNFNQDISGWNVSNVTSMSNMFYNASNFNQDISGWNVSNVTDMYQMFSGATNFNQPLNSWDVSNVTIMQSMFSGATNFNRDISDWDTSKVTDMSNMFNGATGFNRDISGWDVNNVTNMSYMFQGVTLSTANYNKLLIGWSQQDVKLNVNFDGGNSKYSSAAVGARQILINKKWNITDGGVLSSDATLSGLITSTGTLSPVFSPTTTSYTVTVSSSVTSLTVTGTKADDNATMDPSNGKLSFTSLSVGSNEKTITVTSEDGSVIKNYKVKVYRQSNVATLSDLTTTEGSLNPEFNAATLEYTVTVPYETTSLTVTGTKADDNATMDPPDGNLLFENLSVGTSDEKTIKVTAEDGTEKTYTITVTKLPY